MTLYPGDFYVKEKYVKFSVQGPLKDLPKIHIKIYIYSVFVNPPKIRFVN